MSKKKTEPAQQEDTTKHQQNKTRLGMLRKTYEQEQEQELKEFMENYEPSR